MKNIILIYFFFSFFSAFSQLNLKKHPIYDLSGRGFSSEICVGDIDGDGFEDIITNSSDFGVSWRKNLDGNGNFGNTKEIVDGGAANNFFIIDIDGDGFNDFVYVGDYPVAFQNPISKILWRKNIDGNGNFGEPMVVNTGSNGDFRMKIADADNDGDADIFYQVSNSISSYQLYLRKNDGAGNFAPAQLLVSNPARFQFFIADINGDDLADFVISGTSIFYYQQISNGTFVLTENLGSTSGYDTTLTGADIDGDGDIDIVKLYLNGAMSTRMIKWYKNNNNVFATEQNLIPTPPSLLDSYSFEMKDMDNDGKPDIVGRGSAMNLSTNTPQQNAVNEIAWFKNLGNSVFGAKQIISNAVPQNNMMVIADINEDGNQDILLPSNEKIVWLDNANGNASSFGTHYIDDYINIPFLSAIADVDGDGTKDVLIASNNTKQLAWYKNVDGLGTFSEAQNSITTSLQSFNSALLVDVNNDGNKDIVASSNFDVPNKIIWLANDGNGNFGNEQIIYNTGINSLITVDVDNDGDQDLISYFSYNNPQLTSTDLKVFKNNGNGFDPPLIFTYPTNNFKNIEAVDMDYDGDLDFMIYQSSSMAPTPKGLYWIENTDGNGNYGVLHPTTLQYVASKPFAVNDLNNDGLKDIIYHYKTPQGNDYLKMATINTDGTLTASINLFQPVTGGDFGLLKMVDLDLDGDLDILSEYKDGNSSGGSNYFFWFENMGNGSVVYRSIFNNIPQVGSLVFLEDMNADGKIDFALTYDREIVWYQNAGTTQNQINGKVNLDLQNNNCSQVGIAAQQVLITTENNDSSVSHFTDPNGNYSFKVGTGEFITSVANASSYFSVSPESYTNQFDALGNQETANFCFTTNQLFNDLEISFYPTQDARPGFISEYTIVAKNKGAVTLNTLVTINFNNGKINFLNSSPAPVSQNGNSLTFEINNLLPFQSYQTKTTFQVNTMPLVNIGDILEFTIENEVENDIFPENNNFQFNQMVVGAYDPNDIIVMEGNEVHIDNSDEYLHYIVRFQNTGNYNAERVKITTILDEKLDWKTLELETYSHQNTVEITDGSSVNFLFDAIYLPAKIDNEETSNGYIAFKIRPKPSIALNEIVNAKAQIYFDYNPAIITNEVSTIFTDVLDVLQPEKNALKVYPNPVSNLLYFANSNENYKVEVFNILGISVSVATNCPTIDFSKMSNGVYLVKVTTVSGKIQVMKIIKN